MRIATLALAATLTIIAAGPALAQSAATNGDVVSSGSNSADPMTGPGNTNRPIKRVVDLGTNGSGLGLPREQVATTSATAAGYNDMATASGPNKDPYTYYYYR